MTRNRNKPKNSSQKSPVQSQSIKSTPAQGSHRKKDKAKDAIPETSSQPTPVPPKAPQPSPPQPFPPQPSSPQPSSPKPSSPQPSSPQPSSPQPSSPQLSSVPSDSQAQFAAFQRQLEKLTKELASVVADNARIRDDNTSIRDDNTRIRDDNTRIRDDNARIIEDNNARLAKMTEDNEKMKDEMKNDNTRMRNDNTRIKKDNEKVKKDNARITEENRRIMDENTKMKEDILILQSIVDLLVPGFRSCQKGLRVVLDGMKVDLKETEFLCKHGTLDAIYHVLEKRCRENAGNDSFDVVKLCRDARQEGSYAQGSAEGTLKKFLQFPECTLIVEALRVLEDKKNPGDLSMRETRNNMSHYTISRIFARTYVESQKWSDEVKKAANELIQATNFYALGKHDRLYFADPKKDTSGYDKQNRMVMTLEEILEQIGRCLTGFAALDRKRNRYSAVEEPQKVEPPKPKPRSPGYFKDFPALGPTKT